MTRSFEEIRDLIGTAEKIELAESFEISRSCSKWLCNPETAGKGRELAIRILGSWDKVDLATHDLWNELVEASGLYPYLRKNELKSNSNKVRLEFHKSKYLPDIFLHEEQIGLSLDLESGNSIIVSAPTSFGKSLLIEEVVASNRYNNIVIIQPTLALLDETRKKLRKYQEHYKIIVSTHQKPSATANIFLLTPERVVEYGELPQIDFFVIDEFYKLSMDRDDERASVLNLAFYRLLQMTKKFYLLGPNIEKIPDGFENKYSARFIKTYFSTVAVNIEEIRVKDGKLREKKLFDLLIGLKEPTMIYCSSPPRANKLAAKFIDFCEQNKIIPENKSELEKLDLVEWINQNVHPEWLLKKALLHSVGIHHGALPRHIGSAVVDNFNSGTLNYLFCTSTLIEGVNTVTKNVILYDKKKGPKQIDYFDFKNIVGRTGRMKTYFIGNVYKFYEEPPTEEVQVDIPFYTQKSAESELLIQLSPDDIKDKNSELFKLIESLDPEIRALVKSNKGVSVEGQLELIKDLESNLERYYPFLAWTGPMPTFYQLCLVIELGWKYLLTKGESRSAGIVSPRQLAYMAMKYNSLKSISRLIEDLADNPWPPDKKQLDKRTLIQEAINNAFQMRRHWFEYRLPKLIKTVSNIQSFVLTKHKLNPGNYFTFADQIESDFLPKNLAILLEYGIPTSAIRKLEKYIDKNLSEEEIIKAVKGLDLGKIDFIKYEINKINNAL